MGKCLELLVLVLPLFLLFLLQPNAPAATDMALHLRLSNDYSLVLASMTGMPDWDPLVCEGRGALTFRFVGQLPLLAAAFFQLIGCETATALKLAVLSFAIAGSAGMSRWLGGLGLSWPRRLAGGLVFFSGPALALHLFHNFFFQNLCAVLLFPCVLAGISSGWVSAAIGIGLMGWTHLQMTFVCTCLLGGIALIQRVTMHSWKPVLRTVAAAVVGGMLAAPFWLPAVLTIPSVHVEAKSAVRPGIESLFLDDVFQQGREGEIGRISGLMPLLDAIKSGGGHIHGEDGSVLFRFLRPWMLLLTLLFLLAAILGAILVRRHGAFPAGVMGFLAAAAMFRFSMPLWQAIPVFAGILEFSWRLLLPMQILLTPLIADGGMEGARAAGKSLRGFASPLIIAMVFGAPLAISAVFTAVSIPLTREKIALYINEASTVAPMFLPVHAPLTASQSPMAGVPFALSIRRGAGRIEPGDIDLTSKRFTADISSGGAEIGIATHYDQDWRLSDAYGEVAITPDSRDGTMIVELSEGRHELHLERRFPRGRIPGWILMIGGMVVILLRKSPSVSQDEKGV